MKYSEGQNIKVTLLKEIGFNDAEKFYLFKTADGDRFLLEKDTYKNYGFESGKEICARIDRINCSGKIFIEPEHPVYKDNQAYLFERVKVISISDHEADMLVNDCFDNIIPVKTSISKKDETKPVLTVSFCRKGIPLLFDPELDQSFSYQERRVYPFIIDRFQTETNGVKEMVLRDSGGILQFLPAQNYAHYNFKKGQTIECEVVRIKPGRILSLEPVHPFLKKGEILILNYISPLSKEEELFHKHKLHKLQNRGGDIFLISDRFVNDTVKKGMHQYKIDAFKKGQVYVEPINY